MLLRNIMEKLNTLEMPKNVKMWALHRQKHPYLKNLVQLLLSSEFWFQLAYHWCLHKYVGY